MNGADGSLLKGKKVVILDDVVSTGVTMRMMEKMMEKVGALVMAKAAILKQGKQFDRMDDLIYLEALPIFQTDA
jgi:adenine phosphoribosyltransferase